MADPLNSGRKPDGRFAPGNSANPAGRPRGARHKAVQALDLLGRNVGEEIIMAVIAQAKGGDMRAADIILKRIWPERKGAPLEIDLPAIETPADILAALNTITEAASTGSISPDEAEGFTKLIEAQRKAIETADLAARIAALEAKETQP